MDFSTIFDKIDIQAILGKITDILSKIDFQAILLNQKISNCFCGCLFFLKYVLTNMVKSGIM